MDSLGVGIGLEQEGGKPIEAASAWLCAEGRRVQRHKVSIRDTISWHESNPATAPNIVRTAVIPSVMSVAREGR